MKVLHLISGGDSGGAKTHVLSLLKDLNESITADLVCYMEGAFSREARALGIPVTVIDGGFRAGLRGTRELIKSGGYDVVHCHGSRANLTGAILKKGFDIPFISTVHSDYKLDYLGRPLANLTYGSMNRLALHAMDYRVCVSDQMRETLIARGFDPNDLFAIYNGVDFSRPKPNISRAGWLEKIGCDFADDTVIVGIGARLDPVKDVATTVRGFAEAAAQCDKLRLLIAGDGQEMETLKALAKELKVSDRVFFAGWVSDMDGYYASVDINVISSISETFPYAVTEAARAGIPTVASRVGGLPKLIIPGQTGMLFEPGDYKTLGEHLLKMARDEKLRRKMGEAVYDKARREFSTESTCRRQIEIYNAVLRRRAQKRSGVVICGSYGHGNAGDEAILKAILGELRTIDKDMRITVVCKDRKLINSMHAVNAVQRWNLIGLYRELRRAKLFISGGGSLIQDVTSRRSLIYYLHTISKAKKLGCRVQMYGCGIGPINSEIDRRLSASVIDKCVDIITVRDPESAKLLNELCVTKPEIILAADPVLNISVRAEEEAERFLEQCGIDHGEDLICVSMRPWPGFFEKSAEISEALRYCHEKYGLKTVLMPMNYKKDLAVSRHTAETAGVPFTVLPDIDDAELAIAVMKKMKLVLAMRLHCLLYAACAGIPAVGVSYDPKVSGFSEYLGGYSIDLYSVTAESLKQCIDMVLSGSGRERRLRSLADIKEKEKLNIAAAKRLLED